MSQQMRERVNSLVTIQNDSAKGDLLDPNLTQTDLIAMLARLVLPPDEGGLGYKLLLTSIRSDHSDDTCLGLTPDEVAAGVKNHGHTNGYAVDIGEVNGEVSGSGPQTQALVRAAAGNDGWVTKVGLGGAAQAYLWLASVYPQTMIFADNAQPHVHLQTQ